MRNNIILKLICLIICLAISLAAFGGCKKNKKDNTSSNSSSDTAAADDSSDDISDNEDDSDDSDDSDDTEDEDDFEDEDWDDEEDLDDGEVIDDPESDKYSEYTQLKVYNAEPAIMTNYRGASGAVYHAYSFVQDDKTGRNYSKDMLNEEVRRLKDCGIHYMRTRFETRWMWNSTKNNWDFDTKRMGYFYDYCRAMAGIDAQVILQVGYNNDIYLKGGISNAIKEADYLGGFDSDVNGESTKYADCVAKKYKLSGNATEVFHPVQGSVQLKDFRGNINTVTQYYNRMEKTALRFGDAYAKLLKELKARGINNIGYLLYFTEPSPSYDYPDDWHQGPTANEYLFVSKTIKNVLEKNGVAGWVNHVGPNQYNPDRNGLLRWVVEREPDLFNILTCHMYAPGSDITSESYYDLYKEYYNEWYSALEDHNLTKTHEMWTDEHGTTVNYARDYNGWFGLQDALSGITGQQNNLSNIVYWQFADQLWTDQVFSNSEFEDGVHATGMSRCLLNSAIPKDGYYTYGLFTKYQGYKNGTVYRTNIEEGSGVYMSAVKQEDGTWTVNVVNLDIMEREIMIRFDKSINQTLYRHVQGADNVNATTKAHLASADKAYKNVKGAFVDTVEPSAITIYTGCKF